MRILFSSTAGAGHFGPLVPFVGSCLRAGHEVLVAGPAALRSSAEATGATFWPFGDPPPDEMAAVYDRLPTLARTDANALVIGEIFARLDAAAAVPRLREAMSSWRPDLVIRESAEFGAAVAAELHGIPTVRVGIGLGVMEEYMLGIAAANLDELRRSHGLPGDLAAAAVRDTPYLTLFPASIEDPAAGANPVRPQRFRDPAWAAITPVGSPRPLVYVTFGTVAGSLPHIAGVYAEALAAVADLDADVLMTIGRGTDLASLGTPPPHVRIHGWVDQFEVLGGAAAVVCHGGGGTTLGALAAGVPIVAVPLFSSDQFLNADRIAATATGRGATPDAASIRAALDAVLTDPRYRSTAQAVAAELAAHPSTDDFLAALTPR